MNTGTLDYFTSIGDEEIELTLRITYERTPPFPGDWAEPSYPEGFEWIKAEIDLFSSNKPGPDYRQRRFLDVSASTDIGDFLDAEMKNGRLEEAMAEDWRKYGDAGFDPDDAYDAARDRRLMGDVA